MTITITDKEEVGTSARVSLISTDRQVPGGDNGGSTCLCCYHMCPPQGRRLSRAVVEHNRAWDGVTAAEIFLPRWATAASYLCGVRNIRATVAGVSHTVVVSVSLVDVGDSRAVVEEITQA